MVARCHSGCLAVNSRIYRAFDVASTVASGLFGASVYPAHLRWWWALLILIFGIAVPSFFVLGRMRARWGQL